MKCRTQTQGDRAGTEQVAAPPLVSVTLETSIVGTRFCAAVMPLDKIERVIEGADAMLTRNGEDVEAIDQQSASGIRMILATIKSEFASVRTHVRSLAGVLGAGERGWGDMPELDQDERECIAGQIAELRLKVEALARKPQPGKPLGMTCINGPLAGLSFRVTPEQYNNPNINFGPVQTTDRGLVEVAYVQSGQPGKLRFRDYDLPGGRAVIPVFRLDDPDHPLFESCDKGTPEL